MLQIFARFEGSDVEEVRGWRRGCVDGLEKGGGGMGNADDAVWGEAEAGDGFAADGFRRREDEGGEAEFDEQRRAAADARRGLVLEGAAPGREIVEAEDAGAEREVGDGEIGAMEDLDAEARELGGQAEQPPAAVERVGGARESLIGEEVDLVRGEGGGEGGGELRGVPGDATGGNEQGCCIQRNPHCFDDSGTF